MTIQQTRWGGLALGIAAALLLALFLPTLSSTSQAQNPTLPPAVEPVIVGAAYQRFENGYMLWRQDTRKIYVMYGQDDNGCTGRLEVYDDLWTEGLPATDPAFDNDPGGRQQPERGFGLVWRTGNVRGTIGWPTEPSTGITSLFATYGDRLWANGTAQIFILDPVAASWELVDRWRPDGRCGSNYATP
ncbi:MAG: hypothetical protein HC915_20090 [Anaerolineae bacterium]|nr:hypothetical protein [Anaerolineae bacterium]